MSDFRLKVFYTVAQRLNFTKAADELFISQPAVSKHIKELEKQYQCSLFERTGNKLKLTSQGRILEKYAQEILHLYKEMDAELNHSHEKYRGILKIGASTTAAQYVLPQFLAVFKRAYPGVLIELKTTNTEQVEELLLDQRINIGIVEGKSKRNTLDYLPFLKDEIVLCTKTETPTKAILKSKELYKLALIIREKGSGTLEIIRNTLLQNGIKLDELPVEMVLENNESIKTYLQHSNAFAFISISAITEELKHNQLKIIDLEDLQMERYFYIVTQQGQSDQLTNRLKDFLIHNQ